MLNRRLTPIVLILSLLLLPGCGGQRSALGAGGAPASSQKGGPPIEKDGPPMMNWDNPYGAGAVTFATIAEVDAVAPFKVVVPAIGLPAEITTPDPATMGPNTLVVGLVYHLDTEGTVLVQEQLQGAQTVDHLKSMAESYGPAQADGMPDGPAADSNVPTPAAGTVLDPMVTVSVRGTTGLLIQGEGVGRVMWIEDGLLWDVTGPSISPEQVVALVEKL